MARSFHHDTPNGPASCHFEHPAVPIRTVRYDFLQEPDSFSGQRTARAGRIHRIQVYHVYPVVKAPEPFNRVGTHQVEAGDEFGIATMQQTVRKECVEQGVFLHGSNPVTCGSQVGGIHAKPGGAVDDFTAPGPDGAKQRVPSPGMPAG